VSNSDKPIYCIDTSVLIDLDNHYPRRFFESLWSNIEQLMREGRLITIEQVMKEIKHLNRPEIEKWLKQFPGVVRPFSQEIGNCLSEIMAALPDFVDQSKERDEADQPLVALALAENRAQRIFSGDFVVLTNERRKRPNERRVRIPDACAHFGIRCFSLFELMEHESWRF